MGTAFFAFSILLLIGLQYMYYDGIVTLRINQTKQLAQQALGHVASEVEQRELLRYILERDTEQNPKWMLSRQSKNAPWLDSLEQQNHLKELFFARRADLDKYIFQSLYHQNDFDSIPQFVYPRYLKDKLRQELNRQGIPDLYTITLLDPQGKKLLEYVEPGLLQPSTKENGIRIKHKLFVSEKHPERLTPTLMLWLDIQPIPWYSKPFIPGLCFIVVTMILGVITLLQLSKQTSLQQQKNDFVNNMTHELKTPVSSIILASEMLHRLPKEEDHERRKRYLGIIDQESHRLEKLIERVLQISLFDQNHVNINVKEQDLNDLILKVGHSFSLQLEALGGHLDLDLNADNTSVLGSEVHLTNVIYNLLENAIKYRKPNQTPYICIHTHNEDNKIILRISDNGIGIPPEGLKHIFKRYYRIHQGLRHDVKGFGLGLAYVHTIIKIHKGRIRAESESGDGTQIIITLPNIIQSTTTS